MAEKHRPITRSLARKPEDSDSEDEVVGTQEARVRLAPPELYKGTPSALEVAYKQHLSQLKVTAFADEGGAKGDQVESADINRSQATTPPPGFPARRGMAGDFSEGENADTSQVASQALPRMWQSPIPSIPRADIYESDDQTPQVSEPKSTMESKLESTSQHGLYFGRQAFSTSVAGEVGQTRPRGQVSVPSLPTYMSDIPRSSRAVTASRSASGADSANPLVNVNASFSGSARGADFSHRSSGDAERDQRSATQGADVFPKTMVSSSGSRQFSVGADSFRSLAQDADHSQRSARGADNSQRSSGDAEQVQRSAVVSNNSSRESATAADGFQRCLTDADYSQRSGRGADNFQRYSRDAGHDQRSATQNADFSDRSAPGAGRSQRTEQGFCPFPADVPQPRGADSWFRPAPHQSYSHDSASQGRPFQGARDSHSAGDAWGQWVPSSGVGRHPAGNDTRPRYHDDSSGFPAGQYSQFTEARAGRGSYSDPDVGSQDYRHPASYEPLPAANRAHREPAYQPRGNRVPEPTFKLPVYKGKGDWKHFWLQFETVTRRFRWDDDTTLCRLISSLQDQAMEYVSQLSEDTRSSLHRFLVSMERRFGDHVLPETRRASLATLKKQSKETNEEFAARTRLLVSKAYPGMEGTIIFDKMTVEHMVSGLSDPNLIYDVMSKKPQTVEEALDMIQWHECCKSTLKKKTVLRQVCQDDSSADESDADQEYEIRRVNGKRFVTEERLQQFGRDLKEEIVSSVTETIEKKMNGFAEKKGNRAPRNPKWKQTVECYRCHELGHISRECPLKVKDKATEEKEVTSQTSN